MLFLFFFPSRFSRGRKFPSSLFFRTALVGNFPLVRVFWEQVFPPRSFSSVPSFFSPLSGPQKIPFNVSPPFLHPPLEVTFYLKLRIVLLPFSSFFGPRPPLSAPGFAPRKGESITSQGHEVMFLPRFFSRCLFCRPPPSCLWKLATRTFFVPFHPLYMAE